MKKLLLIIACLVLLTAPAYATVYYGGAAGKDINANDLWFTAVTGSCAGDGSAVAWSTVGQAGNTLVANGCTITIPNGANLTVTVDKISNKETDTPDADCVDGGQFTYVTSASYVLVINANLESGGTTGGVLAISGTAAGAERVTINSTTITAGTAANITGISDTHTVGGVVIMATTITGGSNATAYGINYSASSGSLAITGNCVGATAQGCRLSVAGTATGSITGNCTGGDGGATAEGCASTNTVATTLIGNIIAGSRSDGVAGNFIYNPAATQYIQMNAPASATKAYYYDIPIAGNVTEDDTVAGVTGTYHEPTEAEVQSGVNFGAASALTGSYSAGGGGAWGF